MRIAIVSCAVLSSSIAVCLLFAEDPDTNAATAKSEGKTTTEPGQRVAWTTSRVIGSPDPPPPYRIERVFPQLSFTNPVGLFASPVGDRLFVAELEGTIFSFPRNANSLKPDVCFEGKTAIPGLFRLYGFAFHPQFQTNRAVYLCYVTKGEDPKGTHVSRFVMRDTDPPTIDPESEMVIIQWQAGGHNGGCLKFGPDGCLYISTGDGSPPNPPDVRATGQDLSDLLASVLRINVDVPPGNGPYVVPNDNPFAQMAGARPEIWAYGFRNPWMMSFDAEGNLWVGDVGWELWEMIFRVERGGNYGWSIMEGPQPVRTEGERGPTPILPPAAAHSHIESRSITGGLVYQGDTLKDLKGTYIYGDYVTGKIWSLPFDPKTKTAGTPKELVDTPLQIITFGEDQEGELFVVDYHGGLYRLAANTDREANRDFPNKLSETGLFESVKDHLLAPGILAYEIQAEPWMDGATAERFLAVPGDASLKLYQTSDAQIGYLKGHWEYPSGTVFVKTLSLETEPGNPQSLRRIETQLLHRDEDDWRAYTFAWNEDQTDAVLVEADGRDQTLFVNDPTASKSQRSVNWHFASRTACLVCHVTRAGSVLGFQVPQLDRLASGSNQLARFTRMGLFREPYAELKKLGIAPEAVYPDPYDESASLEARARTYLQVNCAHCHLRGGGGTAPFELLSRLPLEKTGALAARPTQGTFDIFGAEVISPGDPYRSVLYYRMATLGKGRMPHIGSERIDETGLELIHDWIAALRAKSAPEESDRIRERLRKADEEAIAKLPTKESLDHLLSSTSGALRLMHRATPTDHVVLTRALETSAPVRGLFERFLPEDQRTKTLGTAIKPEAILAMTGDAERGRKLFLTGAQVQCRNCHQWGTEGKELGPKLDGIAKRLSPNELLESILEPSKKIDPQFVSYLMETTEGQVHSGLLEKRTTEEVVLKDSAGKRVSVPAGQVELLVPQRKSIMPELLLRDLTAEQAADLLAFLIQLK